MRIGLAILILNLAGTLSCWGQLNDSWLIPEKRLQELSPTAPAAYRDLAEEFSVIEDSKLAKDLTVRLYLICAHHSSGVLKRSALRGLVASARDARERKRLILLAYQEDSQFSDLLFTQTEKQNPVESPAEQTSEELKNRLFDSLRSLRQGKFARAKKIMAEPAVQKMMAKYYPDFSVQEFNKICDSQVISDSVLLTTLKLGWKIRDYQPRQNQQSPAEFQLKKWHEAFEGKLPDRFPDISLATATEYDPAKSIYRNGIWKTPPR